MNRRRTTQRRPLRAESFLAALVAVLVAVGLGCQGEPSTATTASGVEAQPPSETSAIGAAEEADLLCSGAQAEQEQIRRELGGDQLTLGDRARLLVDLAPPRVRLGDDLALLQAPERRGALFQELVAAARRRGVASTEAGALWQAREPRELIAEAAESEHTEREIFVAIATRLGLADCAEQLSGPERQEISAAIETALGDGPAAQRCAALAERFLQQEHGGGERRCVDAGAPGPRSANVTTTDLVGMDGVFAVARVELGDRPDPERVRVRVTFEDGSYKIDKLD